MILAAGAHGEGSQAAARKRPWLLGLLAAVVIATALIVVLVLPSLAGPGSGPVAPFGFGGVVGRVAPGAPGCRPVTDEVCYYGVAGTIWSGLSLSKLAFKVTNHTQEFQNAPSLPLGPGPEVSVLQANSTVVGVWNLSSNSWTLGSGWLIPPNLNFGVVVDTGVTSNATLGNADCWAALYGPFTVTAGMPLA